ncbi:hypothetical protein TWF679_002157 [Orbilia oligospora]|uniref:Sas10 C-terminal domain-containing protein n=1 Tax=Orbilia oligospora TaxID=2813651 RepID=A0A8H8UTZ2_ORBOL|nr:hypothetical protein TWF679_002157 [Orbilia oligospora]
MAKKSKRSRSANSKPLGPRPVDPSDAKLGKKLTTYEDVADSEDEFYLNRDRIDLDEDPAKKRRRLNQDPAFESDEEEMDIEGLPSEEDSDDGEEEEGETAGRADGSRLSDDDDEESEEDEEQDEYADWGQSKKSYYGANEFENDEDAEMEEAEARRIQQKQLQSMSAKDFGVDEDEWNGKAAATTVTGGKTKGKPSVPALDDLDLDNVGKPKKITIPSSEKDKLELLNLLHPEFEPLRQEYLRLAPTYEDVMAKGKEKTNKASLARRKWIVLSAYLGVLSMYFAFLNQPREEGTVVELRDHEIMGTILKWRLEWLKIEGEEEGQTPEPEDVERSMGDMSIDDDDDDNDDDDDDDDDDDEEEEEEEDINDDMSLSNEEKEEEPVLQAPGKAKSKQKLNGIENPSKKAKLPSPISSKEAKRLAKSDAGLADLDSLLPSTTTARQKPKNSKTAVQFRASDDFGDQDVLYSSDAEEKAKRKKSLRFYTAQIHQKSNKRALAGRDAGGDADLPRKERNKDRQERLNADAKKRGLGGDLGTDLGGDSDYDDNDLTNARTLKAEIENDGLAGDEDALDYYNAVASKSLMDKMKKKLQKEAAQTKDRVVETETIDPVTGKRAIGYTIEKNKGLTPHRKKDVRNPRVKKRKKFEAAKKKLGSKKAVYKAPTGAYSGEATGIRTKVIKSVKFS